MVEEDALGDAAGLDQLLDRSRREAHVEDRVVNDVEQSLAGDLALAARGRLQLYRPRRCQDQPLGHDRPRSPNRSPTYHESGLFSIARKATAKRLERMRPGRLVTPLSMKRG